MVDISVLGRFNICRIVGIVSGVLVGIGFVSTVIVIIIKTAKKATTVVKPQGECTRG